MKTDTAPQTKFLKDYKKPDFSVEHLHLTFAIHDGVTTVTAKATYKKDNPAAADIVLDGQNLTLKSVLLNGGKCAYATDDDTLTVKNVPANFTLEIVTDIHPEQNTALEGLYASGGNYCTQCEPEGFRKITYYLDRSDVMTTYTTRIEADKKFPVLLGNGNMVESGDLPDFRHFAEWEDPHPKPSYLFALVAGDLAQVHDTFTTMSGKNVDLYIYVNHGNEDKCAHAMKALKDAMKWDEEKYGREYDLDIFNVVAVNDFNFGAMENKSLNIFNAKLVLAKPETATDADYHAIESVIAHEYFHNWTGNRITCRDWFQLSLKEGLTVFRDQSFSGDMNSHAVQRIDDVERLRNYQFPEDASPMAHPIRPDHYIEINNFYTATVYEKGAEVIRMMHTLMGPEKYRAGTDLYFERHDGQAVTCDDFVQCMQDASGIDLTQFKLWYAQAGTPVINVQTSYDEKAKTFSLTLTQNIPDTFGQTDKKPMHIPVAVGLVGPNGQDMLPEKTRVLHLREKTETFTFDNIGARPVPSLFRGFSAPVKIDSDVSDDDLIFLMSHDSDGFNRWDSGQTYLQRLILSAPETVDEKCLAAFGALIRDKGVESALVAKALTLPSENYLAQLVDEVDVDKIHHSRANVLRGIGERFKDELIALYHESDVKGAYSPDPVSAGKRQLRGVILRYIQAADPATGESLAAAQYTSATNMTDKVSALAILSDSTSSVATAAFDDFYRTWKSDPLVLDKWFSLQALGNRTDTVERVSALTAHPDFTYKNPNRLRALVGSFAMLNPKWFHRADGAGYKLLADTVIHVDGLNPSTAARILSPMRQWRRYDTSRRGLMEKELRRILDKGGVSNDVYEIVSRSLK